jgi:hypothetical protein
VLHSFISSQSFQAEINLACQAGTDFRHVNPVVLGQNRLPTFQAIQVRPAPTSFIPSHFCPAKTDFRQAKLLQSGKNRLPPFPAISGRPEQTSCISSHSRQTETDFLHSMPDLIRPTFAISCHKCSAKTSFLHSKSIQSSQKQRHPYQSSQELPQFHAISVRP